MLKNERALLLIDAGNTAVKWQLIDESGSWAERVAASSQAVVHRMDNATLSAQKFAATLQTALGSRSLVGVSWSCVGPASTEQAIALALQDFSLSRSPRPRRAVDSICLASCGPSQSALVLRNSYLQPAQLGPDRWASAVGLAALAERSVGDVHLIVSAGTATTVDLVRCSADNEFEFMGGWILPGVRLMSSLLEQHTRELQYSVSDACLATEIPKDSQTAISQGIGFAQTAIIAQITARQPVTKLWLQGGNAGFWLSSLRHLGQNAIDVAQCPLLIFNGLAAMGSDSQPGSLAA